MTPSTQPIRAGTDLLFHELFAVPGDVAGHTDLAMLKRMVGQIEVGTVVVSHLGRRYKENVRKVIVPLGPKWLSASPADVYQL
ncbi:MAG: ribonuclease BN (tRNA processing enzyme) [Gammaproteobacteria bacterium]